MKPYQVHLFTEGEAVPDMLPYEPVFVYDNKRYLNFVPLDCFHMKNSEHLRETARASIESRGMRATDGRLEAMKNLEEAMVELKKFESLLLFPDEISAIFAVLSIFNPETTYFVDYETSPSILALLQRRSVGYYNHHDLGNLNNLLDVQSAKVIVVDGVFEWIGNISPINDLVKTAKDNDCIIIANEINSFGFLGRDGRGFVDLFNVYGDINIEVGSFDKFLGGFGCYVGGKRDFIDSIKRNIIDIAEPLPPFMLAVNRASLELIGPNKDNKKRLQELWKNSRYVISRLKQAGFKTMSETPIVVITFSNNDEAGEFRKRLLSHQIIVAQNKERIRCCLSVEHSKADLDYCIATFEMVGQDLGVRS